MSSTSSSPSSPSDYFVGNTIGEGAYGRVVYAKHKATKRNVAIKVIDKLSLEKYPQLVNSVWIERMLLSSTLRYDVENNSNNNSNYNHHQRVVKLWASFHDNECLYFVMECCTGGTLTHVIHEGQQTLKQNERRRIPPGYQQWQDTSCSCVYAPEASSSSLWLKSIPNYVLQIVSALEYIHARGVIHADLKPDNILITDRGFIQLADFGSAVLFNTEENTGNNNNHIEERNFQRSRTQNATTATKAFVHHNHLIGTADYACPEVIRGTTDPTDLTIGVDLWSLGCIIYAMLVDGGNSPFHDDTYGDQHAIESVLDYAKSAMLQLQPRTTNKDREDEDEEEGRTEEKKKDDLDPPLPQPIGASIRPTPSFVLDSIKSPTWQILITGLLHPEPSCRLGASDFLEGSSSSSLRDNSKTTYYTKRYQSIRSIIIKDRNSPIFHENTSPIFIPPSPSWWMEAQKAPMRDGSIGWSAYLI